LWVLICIANQTGTDLTEALKKTLRKRQKEIATDIITTPS
jgi:NTP pyrophosphatase (non-canonical NTP hydrolase)